MGVITYKCPNCGGGLTFNADIQKYRCEYCLSEFSQEELDEIEKKELEKAEKRAEIQEMLQPLLAYYSPRDKGIISDRVIACVLNQQKKL